MAEYMPYTTNYSFYRYFDNDLVEPMNTTFRYNHKVNKIEQQPKTRQVAYDNRVPTLADMMGGFPNIDVNSSLRINNSDIFFDRNGNYVNPKMINASFPTTNAQHYMPKMRTKMQHMKSYPIYNNASYSIVGNRCVDNKNKNKNLPVLTDCISNQTKKSHRKPIASFRSRATTYRRKCFKKQQKPTTKPASDQNCAFVTMSYPTLDLSGDICAEDTLNKQAHSFFRTVRSPWSAQPHLTSTSSCPYCNHCYCLNNAVSQNPLGSVCYLPANKPHWRW